MDQNVLVGASLVVGLFASGCLYLNHRRRANEAARQEAYEDYLTRKAERDRKLSESLRAGAAKATSSVRGTATRTSRATSSAASRRNNDDSTNPTSIHSPLNPIYHSNDSDSCSSRSSGSSSSSWGSCSGSSGSSSYDSGSSCSSSSSGCD